MYRLRHVVSLALIALMSAVFPAGAQKGPFVGLDLGAAVPLNSNLKAHVDTGAEARGYGGYMLNDNLGLQVDVQGIWNPYKDNPDVKHSDMSMIGFLGGPRLNLPPFPFFEQLQAYAIVQGGVMMGTGGALSGGDVGALFATGGGLEYLLTKNLSINAYGRWERGYVDPKPYNLVDHVPKNQGPENPMWATAGLGLKYSWPVEVAPPPPPPPPAPVAAAPAPPPAPVKRRIVLRGVHFDFDKSTIRKDAVPILDEAVSTLKEEKGITVVVEGHTDAKGSDAYNMGLSRRRAAAVKEYLVQHGIAANRMTTEGFGESKPVATNDTDEGRAQNRRVEFKVN